LIASAVVLVAWVSGTIAGSVGGNVAGASPFMSIGRAHADYKPALSGNEPVFILVLGSDARPGTPVNRGLCDSIHILGINPAEHRATLYGIPRDSYVPLSVGGTGKINSAMPRGGPEAQIATVEALTGITFDYYALTGFKGLKSAVDELGGLDIDLPYAVDGYDRDFPEGPQTLDGPSALGLARTRKSLSRGDFDRSLNQGRLMEAALAQFRTDFAADPETLFKWLGAGLRNVETSLSIDELTQLAFLATEIDPKSVTNLVAVGTTGSAGGTSIVNLSDANTALFQNLAADGYIPQKDIPDEADDIP
jgi:LCP family protein required for cell wall assembly